MKAVSYKYTPANVTVEIHTKEDGGYVLVEVAEMKVTSLFFVELCDNFHNISEAEVVQTDYDGVEKIKRTMGIGN